MVILALVFDFYELTSRIHMLIQRSKKLDKRVDKIMYLNYPIMRNNL